MVVKEEFGLRRSRKNKWRFRESRMRRATGSGCELRFGGLDRGGSVKLCCRFFVPLLPCPAVSAVRYGLVGVRAFAWPPGPCGGRAGMVRKKDLSAERVNNLHCALHQSHCKRDPCCPERPPLRSSREATTEGVCPVGLSSSPGLVYLDGSCLPHLFPCLSLPLLSFLVNDCERRTGECDN